MVLSMLTIVHLFDDKDHQHQHHHDHDHVPFFAPPPPSPNLLQFGKVLSEAWKTGAMNHRFTASPQPLPPAPKTPQSPPPAPKTPLASPPAPLSPTPTSPKPLPPVITKSPHRRQPAWDSSWDNQKIVQEVKLKVKVEEELQMPKQQQQQRLVPPPPLHEIEGAEVVVEEEYRYKDLQPPEVLELETASTQSWSTTTESTSTISSCGGGGGGDDFSGDYNGSDANPCCAGSESPCRTVETLPSWDDEEQDAALFQTPRSSRRRKRKNRIKTFVIRIHEEANRYHEYPSCLCFLEREKEEKETKDVEVKQREQEEQEQEQEQDLSAYDYQCHNKEQRDLLKSTLWYSDKDIERFRFQFNHMARDELVQTVPRCRTEEWKRAITQVYKSSVMAGDKASTNNNNNRSLRSVVLDDTGGYSNRSMNDQSYSYEEEEEQEEAARLQEAWKLATTLYLPPPPPPQEETKAGGGRREEVQSVESAATCPPATATILGLEAHFLTPHCRMERLVRRRTLYCAVFQLQPYSSLTSPTKAELKRSGHTRVSRRLSKPSEYFCQQTAQALALSLVC
ncbi:hypothetical protein ACA910_011575 [Epithemia clementina (nom. ined.)]